jgi:hypothetical protein
VTVWEGWGCGEYNGHTTSIIAASSLCKASAAVASIHKGVTIERVDGPLDSSEAMTKLNVFCAKRQ